MQSAQAIITLLHIPPYERRKVIKWIDTHREGIETDDGDSDFFEAVANDSLADIWNTDENEVWNILYAATT